MSKTNPTDFAATKNTKDEPYRVGGLCYDCGEKCEPYHWMKHDPEGAEEEMFGDDWP